MEGPIDFDLLSAGSARADHDHSVHHGGASAFGAGVTMVAASFDTMLYAGNYEGVVPALHWSNERFGAGVNVALYRLEKNGARVYGFGDLVAHAQATLVGNHNLNEVSGLTIIVPEPASLTLAGAMLLILRRRDSRRAAA